MMQGLKKRLVIGGDGSIVLTASAAISCAQPATVKDRQVDRRPDRTDHRFGPEQIVESERRKAYQAADVAVRIETRASSEEHTSDLESLMRLSSAVFCLQKQKTNH